MSAAIATISLPVPGGDATAQTIVTVSSPMTPGSLKASIDALRMAVNDKLTAAIAAQGGGAGSSAAEEGDDNDDFVDDEDDEDDG